MIFFIGINIISVKLGNIIPYFIYESIYFNNNNKIKNILITNPYSHAEKTHYGKINNNLDNYIDNINVKLLKLNEIQNKYSNIFNNKIDNIYIDPFVISTNNINYNSNSINNDIDVGEIKFIIIGNKNLFDYYKINYFVKYINEYISKNNQNLWNNNELYNFNLIDIAKKLLNDSIKKSQHNNEDNLEEKFISLILIE